MGRAYLGPRDSLDALLNAAMTSSTALSPIACTATCNLSAIEAAGPPGLLLCGSFCCKIAPHLA